MKRIKKASMLVVAAACLLQGSPATTAEAQDLIPRDNGIADYHRSPNYRESESHPLRIVAYALHPIGWAFREGIFRPMSAFVSSTPVTRSVFGYRHPFDYREPICFDASGDVPDCRNTPPMQAIWGPRDGNSTAVATTSDTGSVAVSSERQVFFPDVAFEFNKSKLNDLGRGRVRQIAQLLGTVPSLQVVVEGHTDLKGTDSYNAKLGERRAQVVVKELTDLGIDPARMTAASLGKTKPIFTEDEPWARAVNRRVQFSVKGDVAPTKG